MKYKENNTVVSNFNVTRLVYIVNYQKERSSVSTHG